VKHTSPIFNFILKRALPYLEPTRYGKVLKRFANYSDLRAKHKHSDSAALGETAAQFRLGSAGAEW
jgi:hypothetical protein